MNTPRSRQRLFSGSNHFITILLTVVSTTRFLSPPSSSSSLFVRGMAMKSSNNNNNMKQKVAVIGGGIAGLSCAQQLASASNSPYDVTVFDTGRLRPGGRCSTRQSGDVPKQRDDDNAKEYPLLSKYRYDHAAQLISVNKDQNEPGTLMYAFQQQLQQWEKDGVVTKFPPNSVGRVTKNGKVQAINGQDFYHGTNGMGNIALSMIQNKNYDLQQDVWVSPSNGVRYQKNTGKWKLQANGKPLGIFDQLVIAHNGKCADRIMSKTPAKDVHGLLRVNFSPTVPAHGGKKMTLNSIYSLTICLDASKSSLLSKAIPEPFVSVFCNHPRLRMITCQTRKYPNNDDTSSHEVWTILSSAKFAKQYKAPQEFLPEDTIEEVSALLLQAVDELLALGSSSSTTTTTNGQDNNYKKKKDDTSSSPPPTPPSTIQPVEKRLQLWGAAVPLNVWNNNEGFIYDPDNTVGVCGDWLVEPSVAGAWTSGRLLANHMLSTPKEKAGLDGAFERSESASKLGIASLNQ